MNFVRLYIGDYLRDTGTLTVSEHGAYMLMLMHHYATERPLPSGRELHRLLRAETKAEREAIDAVAARFWKPAEGGLVNARAIEEMARAEHRRDVNRATGKLGGRPKRTETESVSESETESVSEREPNDNPNQYPLTKEVSDVANATSSSPGATKPAAKPSIPCPYAAIVEAYHEALPTLPKARLMTTKRQAALRQFWGWVLSSRKSDGSRRAESAEQALAWIAEFFGRAAGNDFLLGKTARSGEHEGWRADLDFLLSDKGKKHVIERTQDAA